MTAGTTSRREVLGLAAGLAATAALGGCAEAAAKTSVRPVAVAEGLAHPWSIAFLPDGRLLVTERPGRLLAIDPRTQQAAAIAGVPAVAAVGQGGLLDVALDPAFAADGTLYLSYAGGGPGGAGTEVARARLDGDRLTDVAVIFRADPKVSGPVHFGSRLLPLEDGTLIITLGERGRMEEAQNLGNHLGTTIRIRTDGSVPDDNPFVGRSDARPEIFTYGNRNVQGLAREPKTGRVFAHEHGPRGGDEINVLVPGTNYGWPLVTFGIDYNGAIISRQTAAPGIAHPLFQWTPSIAPCGMAFYSGDVFPDWEGDLLVGSLKFRELHRLGVDGDTITAREVLLEDLNERIRDVRVSPDGAVYVATDAPQGRILRLDPA